MLRVMLVDDEPMALEGLRLLVDWQKEGFEVCASHVNGSDALSDIPAVKPDLIVTDLRMPETDGLTLMARARESGYDGQFLIVSGYSDFGIAQQAMQYKVAGYLLKPIDPDEVSELLETVRTQLIARELRSRPDVPAYHQALTLLLGGQSAPEDALPKTGLWQVVTWGAPLPYERGKELLLPLRTERVQVSSHICDGLEWVVLHYPTAAEAPDLEGLRASLAMDRRSLLVNEPTGDAQQLRAMEQELGSIYRTASEKALGQALQLIEAVSLRRLEESLRLARVLQETCDACSRDVQHQMYVAVRAGFGQQLSDRPERLETFLRENTRDYCELSRLTIRLLAPEVVRVSDQVCRYVEENYASRRLTLDSVAVALSYNSTYLGRLFREETGTGFREWLNAFRAQKAASLLVETDETVYQIAERVGYPQYKQFLQHFKTRYEMTPEQYRKTAVAP